MKTIALSRMLDDIAACTLCRDHLPHGPRPVVQAGTGAKILVAGQAPGRKVHESGVPFDDASGRRLRDWMGVTEEEFYDRKLVAVVPMGFCYPGRGSSGDLPPRPECAPKWRAPLLAKLRRIELVLVIGRYAADYHLPESGRDTLQTVVKSWRRFWPERIPLPHPSPRNTIWLRRNPWFERDVVPALRARVGEILGRS